MAKGSWCSFSTSKLRTRGRVTYRSPCTQHHPLTITLLGTYLKCHCSIILEAMQMLTQESGSIDDTATGHCKEKYTHTAARRSGHRELSEGTLDSTQSPYLATSQNALAHTPKLEYKERTNTAMWKMVPNGKEGPDWKAWGQKLHFREHTRLGSFVYWNS